MRKAFTIILLLLFTAAGLLAQEDMDENLMFEEDRKPFKLTGEYKNLYAWYRTDRFFNEDTMQYEEKNLSSDLNRLRLSPEFQVPGLLLVHADMDNEVIISNYHNSQMFDTMWRPTTYNDLYDPRYQYDDSSRYYYQFKLHRAYAKLTTRHFTVTAGRQLIRYGSGKLWNPLDIVNPVSPTLIEGTGEVKGTDALRVEWYPVQSGEISVVYAPQRRYDEVEPEYMWGDNSILLSRIKAIFGRTDVALLGGTVPGRYIGGFDASTILFDGLLRGSMLYSRPDDYDNFFTAGAGYEYTFKNGLSLLVEYFYNGNALNHNRELMQAYTQSVLLGMNDERYQVLANQFLTFNRHYGGIALGYDITPLLRGDFFTITDVEGRGVFLLPTLKYNVLQNMDISASVMYGLVGNDAPETSDFEEYEEKPLVFASLQYYF